MKRSKYGSQNDFTSEGGSLHDAVKGVMEHDEFLAELSGKEAAESTGRGYNG
jgi:hypothetical protein